MHFKTLFYSCLNRFRRCLHLYSYIHRPVLNYIYTQKTLLDIYRETFEVIFTFSFFDAKVWLVWRIWIVIIYGKTPKIRNISNRVNLLKISERKVCIVNKIGWRACWSFFRIFKRDKSSLLYRREERFGIFPSSTVRFSSSTPQSNIQGKLPIEACRDFIYFYVGLCVSFSVFLVWN